MAQGPGKGNTNNPNGRPKGSQNKDKKALRESITHLIENNYQKFESEILALKGREFVDRMLSLLEYATPKLNRTDLTNDGERFDFSSISDGELIGELREAVKQLSETKSV